MEINQVKPVQTVGIIVNPRKEQITIHLRKLDNWLKSKKMNIDFLMCRYGSKYVEDSYDCIQSVPEKELLKHSQIIITLGGDGTILKAFQSIGNMEIPILGINLGGLGFLADTSPENMIHNLSSCLEGNYYLENRSVLQCKVKNNRHTFYAFNDIVIDKSGFSRVIEIITHVNKSILNSYIADGVIISTPTGSTGYSLSAGGPIVSPQTNVFLINPICPHSLTNRPVIVGDTSIITLKVFTEYKEINVYHDGQIVNSYPSGTSFEISKANFCVRLVKMKKMSFYDTLRNKLHWGDDFRNKQRWSFNEKRK
jgi:NAD+ kinase